MGTELILLCARGSQSRNMPHILKTIIDKIGSGNLIFNDNVAQAISQIVGTRTKDTKMIDYILKGCGNITFESQFIYNAILELFKLNNKAGMPIAERLIGAMTSVSMDNEFSGKLVKYCCQERREKKEEQMKVFVNKIKSTGGWSLDNVQITEGIAKCLDLEYQFALKLILYDDFKADIQKSVIAESFKDAVERNNDESTKCIKYICEHSKEETFRIYNPEIKESLSIAAKNGNKEIVEAIIMAAKRNDYEFDDVDNVAIANAMQIATTRNQNEVVIYLSGMGGTGSSGGKAMVNAAQVGNEQAIETFLKRGDLDPEDETVMETIKAAAVNNHITILRKVMEKLPAGTRLNDDTDENIQEAIIETSRMGLEDAFGVLIGGVLGDSDEKLDIKKGNCGIFW